MNQSIPSCISLGPNERIELKVLSEDKGLNASPVCPGWHLNPFESYRSSRYLCTVDGHSLAREHDVWEFRSAV